MALSSPNFNFEATRVVFYWWRKFLNSRNTFVIVSNGMTTWVYRWPLCT